MFNAFRSIHFLLEECSLFVCEHLAAGCGFSLGSLGRVASSIDWTRGRHVRLDAMAEDWPQIDGVVLSTLQQWFHTPLQLQAAFDDEDGCSALLHGMFPDMVDEDVRNTSAGLVHWQASQSAAFKRLRRCVVDDSLFRLPPGRACDIQEQFTNISQSSTVMVLEMAAKKKQRKYKEESADARSKKVDEERKKYSILLSNVIKQARLPVVQLINTLDDPASGWLHLFAARRANTLKNRYKSWKPFQTWLELHRGTSFPESCKDVIDYMQCRVDDSCGKTIPESFSVALNLLESLGRVPEDQQLSRDPLWVGHVKSWSAELAADNPPRRPAEMYTTAMLVSLEMLVCNESEFIYKRALAWVILVMFWAALRCDDVQSILPHRSLLSNFGLKLVLGKSKTTGPDKPQKEIVAHVYRTISLTGGDWLGVGYRIWNRDEFAYRRDYLVMEPNFDWSGTRRKFVTPTTLSSLIRRVLGELLVPVRQEFEWTLVPGALLLPDGLEFHFSGHSPRNYLTSVAALLGFSKDMRAYLGRWAIGMTSSEEYVRTARQVVYKIQQSVNRSLVEGREDEYFEDEAIDSLCAFAEANGANPKRIRKRHTVMNNITGRHCIGGTYPTLEARAGDWEDVQDMTDDQLALLHEKALEVTAALDEQAATGDPPKYFVTISRRAGHRRLHLSGCFVKPSNCCEVRLFQTVTNEDFDSVCRACRKKMLSESGKDAPGESSSTASSSSTACSQELS
jgi:hypothetical protein